MRVHLGGSLPIQITSVNFLSAVLLRHLVDLWADFEDTKDVLGDTVIGVVWWILSFFGCARLVR